MNKKIKLISANEFHRDLMKNPKFRSEYERLETEYQIASQIIEARLKKKMTQEDLAEKANTAQAVISRLEGMNSRPSVSLLKKVARALDTRISLTIQ